MPAAKKSAASYGADNLTHLEGLEAVRKRPGMYIGSTDTKGLTHLAYEIMDNSVDEALAGHCTAITVTCHDDGSVTVTDNGRGIPVDVNKKTGMSGVELVMTKLHAGGKFGDSGYKVSGGLHGVGSSVVNALSVRTDVTVVRDGGVYEMSFQRGKPGVFTGNGPDAKFTPKAGIRKVRASRGKATGTTVRFWPDSTIFLPGAHVDTSAVVARARQTAFLIPTLTLTVADDTGDTPETHEFHFTGGVTDMVDHLATDKPVNDVVHISGTGTFNETVPVADDKGHMVMTDVERTVDVAVAFRWGTGYDTTVASFVNVVATPNNGTHVKGFERALLAGIRKGYEGTRLLKANEAPPLMEDVKEGLTAVVSVSVPEPQFIGQTKDELGTAGVTKVVQDVIADGVKAWIAGRKKAQAKVVLEKVANASRVRIAARTQREAARRKTALEGATMPAKLVDCRATGVSRSEVFIVEGDSALGCFTGDTLVATVEGTPVSFKDLADDWDRGITHFGYASDETGHIRVVPLVEPRRTKRDASLVEVTLENGERLRCTSDHLFMVRSGEYVRADKLRPGDSLMPLARRFSSKKQGHKISGYEQVFQNHSSTWEYTHVMSDRWNLENGLDDEAHGVVRHHKDFNKLNNHPSNIVRMSPEGHFRLHAEHVDVNRPAILAGYAEWLEDGGREELSRGMKDQWQDPDFAEACAAASVERHRDPEFKSALLDGFQRWYNRLSDEEKQERAARLFELQQKYWSVEENRAAQSERTRLYFEENPDHRERHRELGLQVWEDDELRQWRSEKSREQFADPAERQRQSQAVLEWRDNNPDWVEAHSEAIKRVWAERGEEQREAMLAGRQRYIDNTPKEERVKKQKVGRLLAALKRLRDIEDMELMSEEELFDSYEDVRLRTERTGLKFDNLLAEYDGDVQRLIEAAKNVNHRVVSVTRLDVQEDVYDLTVDRYHNFALEAGVFVHNSARSARNSEYQALLPIRGKILNVQKATLKQMLDNAECASIIQVIGAGSGRTFDIEQMRYGRVILFADADVDGSHIRTLLLTLFYKYMTPVIEHGRLYTAMPPLHKIETAGRNKTTTYTYTQAEMEATVAKLQKDEKTVKMPVQRYKGLGEMNADELWETTMDPTARALRRITLDDAQAAEKALETLMGSNVESRRSFIIDNSDRVDWEAID